MTSRRRRPDAGWVDPDRLPRGRSGRPLCRYCGREVPKGRRTFCGETCVHEWRIRTDPAYVREMLWRRDRGVCAACGRDMHAAAQEFYRLPTWYRFELRPPFMPAALRGRSQWWVAHHVQAVVEGGGECGLDGYASLCYRCHALETAALQARRAAAQRMARRLAEGQSLLPGLEGEQLALPAPAEGG